MINPKETAYETLQKISQIKDKGERKNALRGLCLEKPSMGVFIQYVYHPDVKADISNVEHLEKVIKRSGDDQYGQFYYHIRKLKKFFTTNKMLHPHQKEEQFITMCESIAGSDVELMLGFVRKKLPFRSLNEKFCKYAIPELFPANEKIDLEEVD